MKAAARRTPATEIIGPLGGPLRRAAGVEGVSGIVFVILYKIRVCRARFQTAKTSGRTDQSFGRREMSGTA
jgi:hypothetical protein